ncbi:MAG: FlgD immunoglobulin-like domain containing protein, partial [Candidatus Eisenbacteria bacterium]
YPGNFADVFADWVVANFLDDPTLDDGRFGYAGDDLPAFSVMGTYSSYPVATLSRTVQYWAADYYRFQNLENIPSLRLQFDGSDNNRYAVWALRMPSGGSPAPLRMTVDQPTQSGTIDVSGLGDAGDQVILAVASISSSGATSYTFSADATPADISAIAGGANAPRLILRSSPNPSPGAVTLRLIEDARADGSGAPDARIDLFDAQGRLVREMLGTLRNGAATFVWDGLTAAGRPASPGLYYARARAGNGTAEGRILRLR